MKRLLSILLCPVLMLSLAACGTAPAPNSDAPPSISVLPSPEPTPDPNSQQEPYAPPIPADAAMYRGTVTGISYGTPPADGSLAPVSGVTLTQSEGTDFGAPSLKFAFVESTYANFTPEEGQYLEVYYGTDPGKPLDTDAVHEIMTAIQYHSAEMVNFNGYVKAIEPHPEKPNEGRLVMVSSLTDADPYEIHYLYDKDETQFYLNFDEIKTGDRLNIFQSGAVAMSMPPQAFAIEVRYYK